VNGLVHISHRISFARLLMAQKSEGKAIKSHKFLPGENCILGLAESISIAQS
jgi:hypothetical protein